MRGSADTTGMPDVKSRPAVFRFEIVSQDWLQEMKLESTSDFSVQKCAQFAAHFSA